MELGYALPKLRLLTKSEIPGQKPYWPREAWPWDNRAGLVTLPVPVAGPDIFFPLTAPLVLGLPTANPCLTVPLITIA